LNGIHHLLICADVFNGKNINILKKTQKLC